MPDRKSWWPYVFALLSALMAPSALKHAMEEPPAGAPTDDKAVARSISVKPDSWDQFVCSYFYPKQTSGYCPEPDKLSLPLPVEYVIAGVPDPEATSIPATFDVMVEALIGAAAAEGWRYDRNWLPWGSGKADDRKVSSPESPTLTNEQPGLLLFRKLDRMLVVFLVGETPTSGVNKSALVKAARFIYARSAERIQLRVLGPRFSGSVPAYRFAIETLLGEKNFGGVHFVTGSATRKDNAADLLTLSLSGQSILYEAAVEHDSRTQELFLDWLDSRGIPENKIAILSEGGTAFGASLGKTPDSESLHVEFPYQISRLRNAYEKDPELKALWVGPAASKDKKLDWSLKTDREDTDWVRTFQGAQTTLLQERQLEQLATEISRRGIRAVGINATDILDTVFLTLYLRRQCPDVRVFTLDSDLLFTYSRGALAFNGMLMVSPYPLWLNGQRGSLFSFANRSAQGVHNAFVRLVHGTEYRGHTSPATPGRPAIWVTTASRGQAWPLAALDDQGPSQLVTIDGKKPLAQPRLRPDWTYWLLLLGMAALVLYGVIVFIARRIAERGAWSASFDPAFFFLFEPPDPAVDRTLYTQLLCAIGIVALLPFTVWGGTWLCVTAAALLLWTTAIEANRKAAWATGLCLAVLVILLGAFWFGHWQAAQQADPIWNRYFFNYRLLNPASGISPLPSWTLAWFGCAWWAVSKLNQIRTHEVRSPRLDSWPPGEPLLGGIDQIARNAHRRAERVLNSQFLLVLLVWFLLLRWTLPNGLSGLEDQSLAVNWIQGVQFAFILLVLLLLLTVAQLYETHKATIELLNNLVDHPLGDAFKGLPKDLAASQLWLRGNNRFPFQSCLQGMRRLRQLTLALAPGAPPFKEMCQLEKRLGNLLEISASDRRLPTQEIDYVHTEFNRIAAAIYPLAAAGWQEKPHPQQTLAEEFLALRLASLLRYLVMQMRSMIEYLSFGLVMLIVAIVSYPFEPQRGLVNMVAALVAVTGFTVVMAVSQLDRHPVMQLFASREGAPSFLDTIRKLAAFGFAPLVAIFTALFPGSISSLSVLIEAAGKYLGR